MKYETTDEPKQLRETLCIAQSQIGNSALNPSLKKTHMDRLQRLINDCDGMWSFGPDGKHGNMHTDMCGCAPRRFTVSQEELTTNHPDMISVIRQELLDLMKKPK